MCYTRVPYALAEGGPAAEGAGTAMDEWGSVGQRAGCVQRGVGAGAGVVV